MTDNFTKTIKAGAVALGLLWACPALAQTPPGAPIQPPPEGSVLTGVEVLAPKVIERSRYGVVTREARMSVRVPYGDLNLQTVEGMAELDRRVVQGANYVCDQLERLYPSGSPDPYYCAREAVGDARPQVIMARGPG